MSYSTSDNKSKNTEFCKLRSDLIISYNGSFLECIPSTRSSLVGTVLTPFGELVSRTSRRGKWVPLSTPSVYLFYDKDSKATFEVNTCEPKIREIEPHGRILDCTDRVIYEIKCGNWVPICDLSNKQHRTIVLCNTVPASATTASFEFPGINPVIDLFSEIFADQVVFTGNNAVITFRPTGPGSLPVGGCAVLIFTVCIDGEFVTIVKIFLRQAGAARVALQCASALTPIGLPVQENSFCGTSTTGTLGGIGPGGSIAPITPSAGLTTTPVVGAAASAATTAILANNVSTLIGWAIRYNVGFVVVGSTGTIQVLIPGDYLIDPVISYEFVAPLANSVAFPPGILPTGTVITALNTTIVVGASFPVATAGVTIPIPRTQAPRFVLFRGTAISGGIVEAEAPLSGQRLAPVTITVGTDPGTSVTLPAALDLNESGQAVIDVGLRLTPADILRVAFVDQSTVTITLAGAFFANLGTFIPGLALATPVTVTIPTAALPGFALTPIITAGGPGSVIDPVGTTFNAALLG